MPKPPLHVYSPDPTWSDISPIHAPEDPESSLASIAYTAEYIEVTSYLRAVMSLNEQSERVLALTEHMIELNPAHYTVWLYRAKVLEALKKDLREEMVWLNGVSLKFIKNYQIWHHRQVLLERMVKAGIVRKRREAGRVSFKDQNSEGGGGGDKENRRAGSTVDTSDETKTTTHDPHSSQWEDDESEDIIEGEFDFINQMLAKDAKNYHVWSYRQWLVRFLSLWDDGSTSAEDDSEQPPSELEDLDRWLDKDVRNNSAWNHRWFIVFGRGYGPATVRDEHWERELQYAMVRIRLAPQNESPWNYIRGLVKHHVKSAPLREDNDAYKKHIAPARVLPTTQYRASAIEFASGFLPNALTRGDFTDSGKQSSGTGTEVDPQNGEGVEGEGDIEDEKLASGVRSTHALDFMAEAWLEQVLDGKLNLEERRFASRKVERAFRLLATKLDPIRRNYWDWRRGMLPDLKVA
ncbi:MAG: CAAX geranylgeranyltransferase alpha subunit [Alyxoria varia]|nr:MAG: CAAX geranylgeranyltransferase alpha subunit [Alyxoria varia]